MDGINNRVSPKKEEKKNKINISSIFEIVSSANECGIQYRNPHPTPPPNNNKQNKTNNKTNNNQTKTTNLQQQEFKDILDFKNPVQEVVQKV